MARPKKNNKEENSANKERKIKIKVTDIVAKPVKTRIKKGAKPQAQSESEKLIQIQIPQGAKVEEPAIIDVVTESKEEIQKELMALEKRAAEFEVKETERFIDEEKPSKRGRRRNSLGYLIFGIILLVVLGGGYAAYVYLPKVKIDITTEKSDWKFNNSVLASKSATGIDVQNKIIPAEIFSQRKNLNYSFPASGKKYVENKASGMITIYNAYGSDPQGLVATTRFATPDGKIFRLVDKVVVPGAKIVNGKITPSSIDAQVTADKAGSEYNVGPVDKFTIPGFAGTQKYDGFYASSKDPMKGGAIGQSAYPTDQDIKNADIQAKASLKSSTDAFLKMQISSGFVIMDGSEQFSIIKETINKSVDDKGYASIFLDAQGSIIAFQKSDVLALMRALANNDLKSQNNSQGEDYEILNNTLDFANAKVNNQSGQISMSVNFGGSFWQPVNVGDFTNKSLGKKESDLRALIYSLPGVGKAQISFWPFWVQSVPNNAKRVTVNVD